MEVEHVDGSLIVYIIYALTFSWPKCWGDSYNQHVCLDIKLASSWLESWGILKIHIGTTELSTDEYFVFKFSVKWWLCHHVFASASHFEAHFALLTFVQEGWIGWCGTCQRVGAHHLLHMEVLDLEICVDDWCTFFFFNNLTVGGGGFLIPNISLGNITKSLLR